VAWINSARTYVEIQDDENAIGDKTYAGFVSESGSLEFFVFASSKNNGAFNRVKKV
jgi:hypothetical protein